MLDYCLSWAEAIRPCSEDRESAPNAGQNVNIESSLSIALKYVQIVQQAPDQF